MDAIVAARSATRTRVSHRPLKPVLSAYGWPDDMRIMEDAPKRNVPMGVLVPHPRSVVVDQPPGHDVQALEQVGVPLAADGGVHGDLAGVGTARVALGPRRRRGIRNVRVVVVHPEQIRRVVAEGLEHRRSDVGDPVGAPDPVSDVEARRVAVRDVVAWVPQCDGRPNNPMLPVIPLLKSRKRRSI